MLIKIKHNDKVQMHDAKSYYRNQLVNQAMDLNIDLIDGEMKRLHFDDCREVECFIMNDQGKTIDRI